MIEAVISMRTVSLCLPWPDKLLSPNGRTHWAAKAKATKKAKENAYWSARAAGAALIKANALKVGVVFHAPDRRRRDIDNLLSSSKALLDGVAQACGIDDSRWEITMRKGAPRPNGCVCVFLEAA